MIREDIKHEIQRLAERYETADFLISDPSRFMHSVCGDTNRETTAFVASALSYGSRKQFFPKIERIIHLADGQVDAWVRLGQFFHDIPDTHECFYRLYDNAMMRRFLLALQTLLLEHGTLKAFAAAAGPDAYNVVNAFCRHFAENGSVGIVPKDATSACKRVCMFLRWMVRDSSPVDLGLWADIIDKRTLIMPMDTHVMTEAQRLGLISSRTASMSAARRLTAAMSEIFPDDPLKGDFALFGLGVDESRVQ